MGAPLAVFFFTWFGAPIYVVLVAAAVFVVGTLRLARGDDGVPLARAAWRYGAGVLVVSRLFGLGAPGLVMEVHTFKQALFATALFAAGLPAYLLAMRRLTRRGRSGAVALGGMVAMLALLAIAGRVGAAQPRGAAAGRAGAPDGAVSVRDPRRAVAAHARLRLRRAALLGAAGRR